MLTLRFSQGPDAPLKILCLGAHSDDIEIGCGGTLLYLQSILPEVSFYWVVFSAAGSRGHEAAKSAELFTSGRDKELVFKSYRDGFLPYSGGEVKDSFEEMKGRVNPDLIFTQWCGDAHQDHRFISELTWNTFRNHFILEYEIPKYDGDMGRPNVFVPLETALCERKVDYLLEAFERIDRSVNRLLRDYALRENVAPEPNGLANIVEHSHLQVVLDASYGKFYGIRADINCC